MKLTRPQQLIYDADKSIGGSIAVMCGIMTVEHRRSKEQVVAAIREIYRTNDALNLRLDDSGPEPEMFLTDPDEREIPVLEIDDRAALEEIGRQAATTPFDLGGPLSDLRAILWPNGYGILLRVHHLLGDAWSMSLIGTQLNEILEGKESHRYSYLDYVHTEKEYFKSNRYRQDKAFFLNSFDECPSPVLFSNKKTEDYHSATLRLSTVSSQTRLALAEAVKDAGISEFACLFGLFAFFYAKRGGCPERFYLGTPVLGRVSVQDLNTVGMYVNTVPVPIRLDYDASLLDNLKQIADSLLSVFRHQRYNYGELLRELRLSRQFGGRLYDTLVNYQSDVILADYKMVSREYSKEMQTDSLQIQFNHRNGEDGLVVDYFYRTALLDASDIRRVHTMLEHVLHSFLQQPDLSLKKLCLVSPQDPLWNAFAGEVVALPYNTVYELFLKNVHNRALKAEIIDQAATYSFEQLETDAAAIDVYVRRTAGSKKQVIGILCNRSYLELAAIFGVIRGGNAYLPISPDYPQERIKTILKTSGCKIVLAQKQFVHLIDSAQCLEDILLQLSPAEVPPPAAKPEDLLYVIYTSGSTGTPKGAMVSNRSAVNRIKWMSNRYFDASTVVMRKTPYTFDVSVWEIFGFAMSGFSLYILPQNEHYSQSSVLSHIERGQVTDLHFVPTMFEQFLSVLKNTPDAKKKMRSLRHVFLSGESLSAKAVNTFHRYHDGQITVHNLYGPAECTIDVTAYDCSEAETDPVPIGKPIANTQIYILDQYMQPVPVGVTGELCIAGMNVGQGYLNQPELTEEKFVDHPFGVGKLYKTGDLACWREDGNIIFIGRNDLQVKINGQRVELGEIDAAISALDGIDSATVVVKKEEDRQILCAFYTGRFIDAVSLRQKLRTKLPIHMIPASFHHIDAMPINVNGKTDRKVLEAMAPPALSEKSNYSPPQNELESQICQAFCSVLKTDRVGRDDNFYDLGGSSLDMIRLLSGEPLHTMAPAAFMRCPTPAALSRELRQKRTEAARFLLPLFSPDNPRKALVLFSFGGGDASAYTALVAESRRQQIPLALYYVPWLEEADYPLAAKEIQALAQTVPVHFYSHCAGAATALKLLARLNQDQTLILSYIAAATIPPRKGKKAINPWHLMNDRQILWILAHAGLPTEDLTKQQKADLIQAFRLNTDEFFSLLRVMNQPVRCETTLIINKKDIFTLHYGIASERWSEYVSQVASIRYFNSRSHYFQSSDARALTELLKTLLFEEKGG